MSIAQKLPEIVPFFMQECPLCGRSNRMVIQGIYRDAGKKELHPDLGYSFCNCKCIFYTRKENVKEPFSYEPVDGIITAPDHYFVEWGVDPYSFPHWNIRKYEILWNMDTLCEELEAQGYVIEWAMKDFNVHSKTPMHFHIKVKK